MRRVYWLGKRGKGRGEYAGREEFVSAFKAERMALKRLALLLTANSEQARRCLDLAFRECVASSAVCKGWVLTWIRRVIIRNAIKLVKASGGQSFIDAIGDAGKKLIASSDEDSLDPIANASPILHLPEFDRLVFVICVLEHYSIQDCALLLGRSPGDVSETRRRAANQVEQIDEMGRSLRLAMC